jgi:hypothetical protein
VCDFFFWCDFFLPRIELKVWYLLGRCFSTWATPPALSVLAIFLDRVFIYAWDTCIKIFLVVLLWAAGMTGVYHHTHPLVSQNFLPWSVILLISASQVARITGLSNHTQPWLIFQNSILKASSFYYLGMYFKVCLGL